ncbi:DMT family transporter [Psychrobacter pacificensis]|uniref:EamA-like transporter family protein n=2 Tax=Psychrobacter pacificensis TaxID=112002 RepID=A0A1G6XBY6_9GAMM|nr:DMT family transporter [Psychrobacter pacificensis]SDD74867.1 EamA-like transporter family protein [Psychrobacter pacificensis]
MNTIFHPSSRKNPLFIMSPLTKGYVAMSVVLLIWSGFALTVRAVGASSLSIADVMLIRFSVPLVLLTPWMLSSWHDIKNIRLPDILFILFGGVPFLLLAAFGASTVPAAYMGTILTGTPVFFAALLSFILYRQRISLRKFASLILILFGIATMIGGHAQEILNSLLYGVGLLLLASLIWAGYTLGLKSTTLTPIAIAIVLSYTSFFLTLVMVLSGMMDTNIGSVSFDEVLPFILIQGLGVGVVSTIAFSYAVKQLGSIRTLLLGSLSPGLTAILAALILKESLSVIMICGIALSTIGVILSNRAK